MTGINYAGNAMVNIDTETGVRFGHISANHRSIVDCFWDEVEAHYKPRCPKCGSDAIELDHESLEHEELDDYEQSEYDVIEFACKGCEYLYGEEGYGDEPDSQSLVGSGLAAEIDSHNDIIVTKSHFRTFGRFASPCFPGGVTLDADGDVEAYCLGPDWFTDNPPYDVYTIISGDYYKIVKDTDGKLWACGTDESLKSRIREVRYKADGSLKFKGGTNV